MTNVVKACAQIYVGAAVGTFTANLLNKCVVKPMKKKINESKSKKRVRV